MSETPVELVSWVLWAFWLIQVVSLILAFGNGVSFHFRMSFLSSWAH